MKKIILFIMLLLFPFTVIRAEDSDYDKYKKERLRQIAEEKKEKDYIEGVEDKSITGTYFNKVFSTSLTEGSIGIDLNRDFSKREEINKSILLGTEEQSYTLFDLYGPDLNFIAYFGEQSFDVKLLDHIYSTIEQGKEVKIGDINYKAYTYLSTKQYQTRPRVLTKELINQGLQDPRVDAHNKAFQTSSDFVVGNFLLTLSKVLYSLFFLIFQSNIMQTVLNVIKTLQESFIYTTIITPIFQLIIGFGAVFAIVKIVKIFINFTKGQSQFKDLLTMVFITFLTFGLLQATFINPTALQKGFELIVVKFDRVIEKIAEDYNKNDIALSFEGKVWETVLFDPYNQAMFGKSYDKLYTQYSDEVNKLDQSIIKGNRKEQISLSSEPLYDSAYHTGDIFINLGKGKQLRNWAAFSLATQSKFYIPFEQKEIDRIKDNGELQFPVARTSPSDKNIYVDSFRWIDAKLNISPEYTSTGVLQTYTNSNEYKTEFTKWGSISLYRTFLLLCLLPIVVLRIKYLFAIFIYAIHIVIEAIKYLFGKSNDLFTNLFIKIKNSFIGYFTSTIKLYISLIFFFNLVGKHFILEIVYVLVVFATLFYSYEEITDDIRTVKYFIKEWSLGNNMNSKASYETESALDTREAKLNKEKWKFTFNNFEYYSNRTVVELLDTTNIDNKEYINKRGLVLGLVHDEESILVRFEVLDEVEELLLIKDVDKWTVIEVLQDDEEIGVQ